VYRATLEIFIHKDRRRNVGYMHHTMLSFKKYKKKIALELNLTLVQRDVSEMNSFNFLLFVCENKIPKG
jgi:hypothetical protein